jgi:hypothetical protein
MQLNSNLSLVLSATWLTHYQVKSKKQEFSAKLSLAFICCFFFMFLIARADALTTFNIRGAGGVIVAPVMSIWKNVYQLSGIQRGVSGILQYNGAGSGPGIYFR